MTSAITSSAPDPSTGSGPVTGDVVLRRRIMMNLRTISVLLMVVGCLSACQPKSARDSSAAQQPVIAKPEVISEPRQSDPSDKASGNPVVGHLKTRDNFITIRTGPDGPLYTVKSKSGRVLAVDLSATELSAKFPDLGKMVERGLASGKVRADL
jgi:hypothetical protein